MQTSDTDDNAAIFWPGYVDAISNLVLNLLFLVMILCLAVFVMSQNTQRSTRAGSTSSVPKEAQYEESQPDRGTRLSSGGKTETVQKKAEIEVRPSPQGDKLGAVRIQSQTISEQGAYLEVHYLEDALDLSPAAAQSVRDRLLPLLRDGYSQWELVVVTDTAYAAMRRGALLRLLRLREALQHIELPGLKTNTRIESGGTTASTVVVRLYGRRATETPQNP